MSRRTPSAKLGGAAVTNLIVLMLVYVLFGNSLLEARVSVPARGSSKQTVQESILEVRPGTTVEVRLLNKQKLRGRLGEVTSDGFSLQTAQGTKVETQKIAFTDVKSFKQVGETARKTGNRVVWILAGIGIAIGLIILIGVASSG